MTDDATSCAVLGCDAEQASLQGVNIPGFGWIRLCMGHIGQLLKAAPIEEKDIIIQE